MGIEQTNGLKGKTALVVDDDTRNTFALTSLLEAFEMNVLTAENGFDMFVVLQQQPVDIILLDMMMPIMDGYEALDKLSTETKLSHIPVIAVTAKAMKGDREKCLEAGADEYIAKPVNLQELRDKMYGLIAR